MRQYSSCRTNSDKLLRLFVYGTLKRGCENHDLFCGGALSIAPATVRGKLFTHPAGFPMLLVPEADILAIGTTNPTADLSTQEEFRSRLPRSNPEIKINTDRAPPWFRIQGELITFGNPAVRLPALDELEDFYPGQNNLYTRVLVLVRTSPNSITPAWTYVSAIPVEDLAPLQQNHWSC